MVTRLKEVDVVTVGLGWTAAILARELTKAGLNVVSLEKGQDRVPGEDFTIPAVRDEVRYAQRLELMWDNSIDTLTFRNFGNEQALPIRRIGAFLPGEGVGGSGIHWGALHWRFLPSDFRIRSAIAERYGAGKMKSSPGMRSWPFSRETTFRPALVSSRAMMAPVQPSPIVTASTSFNRVTMSRLPYEKSAMDCGSAT